MDMLRLKRLTEIDPFASNIKERVQFPVNSTIKEELTTSPLDPSTKNDTSILDMLKAQRATPRLRDYESYLGSEPDRKDYQAGKVSKILAAVAGTVEGAMDSPGRGMATYKGITDMPYLTARDTWERKGGRLKELAELEHRGLSDEEKRLVQLENFRLKGLEEARTWLKDQKAMQLSDARINDITNRIKTSGKSIEKNEMTGEMEVVDKITGSRISLGKFAESVPEKAAREDKTWFSRERTRQTNRRSLQEDSQAHATFLENVRTSNDRDLIKFRNQLELDTKGQNISAAESNAAFTGAMRELSLERPDLYSQLFDVNGNAIEGRDEGKYGTFLDMVRMRRNSKLGLPTSAKSFSSGTNSVTTGEPSADDALRAQAIQYLKDNNYDDEDEENINNAMKKILEESSSIQPNAMPQVETPTNSMWDIPSELNHYPLSMPKMNMDWIGGDPNKIDYLRPEEQINASRRSSQQWPGISLPNVTGDQNINYFRPEGSVLDDQRRRR